MVFTESLGLIYIKDMLMPNKVIVYTSDGTIQKSCMVHDQNCIGCSAMKYSDMFLVFLNSFSFYTETFSNQGLFSLVFQLISRLFFGVNYQSIQTLKK